MPLHVACKEGHAELVTLLIRNHADVRATNDDGHNCLNIAIMNAQRCVVLTSRVGHVCLQPRAPAVTSRQIHKALRRGHHP